VKAEELEPRDVRNDAAMMARLAGFVEDRQINPGKARMKAGTPDDVLHVKSATVFEERLPIASARDARDAFDASREDVFWLDARQRRCLGEHFGTQFSADRGADGQKVVPDEANGSEQTLRAKKVSMGQGIRPDSVPESKVVW
jgi:hypothetical protein